MKKFAAISLIAAVATFSTVPSAVFADEAAATVTVTVGKVLYGGDGNRVARIYSVDRRGNPQVIMDGQLYTVPASTLSEQDGKVTTSLTKREIKANG